MRSSVPFRLAAVCLAWASSSAAQPQSAPALAVQSTAGQSTVQSANQSAGQSPNLSTVPPAPRGPRPAPTNIKALPKNITGDELIGLMREYTGDLGVECEFCHAQNPQTKRNDFASDANPLKDTARYMIGMTADLNDKYLEDLPGRRYGDPITCGTCHQGHSHPQVFVPAPRLPRPSAPPATAPAPPTAK